LSKEFPLVYIINGIFIDWAYASVLLLKKSQIKRERNQR